MLYVHLLFIVNVQAASKAGVALLRLLVVVAFIYYSHVPCVSQPVAN